MSMPAKRPTLAKPREATVIDRGSATPVPRSRVQISVYLDDATLQRIEKARAETALVPIDRHSWMKTAILEKLLKDGF